MYGSKIVDPNDIRWNDASYYMQRLDVLENNISAILKEYTADNLKMLISLIDAYIIATFAVVNYDRKIYEEKINGIEKRFYELDTNKDGKVDEYEEMRSREVVLDGMRQIRDIYIDIKCIVTPFLSIDIKKQLKEMRSMAFYKSLDKWVDKNILYGYVKICPKCRERYDDEETTENKRVRELGKSDTG